MRPNLPEDLKKRRLRFWPCMGSGRPSIRAARHSPIARFRPRTNNYFFFSDEALPDEALPDEALCALQPAMQRLMQAVLELPPDEQRSLQNSSQDRAACSSAWRPTIRKLIP